MQKSLLPRGPSSSGSHFAPVSSSPWQQETHVFYPSPATQSLFSSGKDLNFASSDRTEAETEIKLD